MSPHWLLKEVMEKKAWNLLYKFPESQVGEEPHCTKWELILNTILNEALSFNIIHTFTIPFLWFLHFSLLNLHRGFQEQSTYESES